MIPNWSFESPVTLVSPGVSLLPRTHPNPSTCALTIQSYHHHKTTNEAILFLAQLTKWHRTGHLPLQRNRKIIIVKLPSSNYSETNYFLELRTHLMKNTKKFPRNGRRIGSELGPVPTLSRFKMAGQQIWDNNNCIISMQGFAWVIFLYGWMDRWFHLFSSKGLGKSQFTSILLTEARISLYNLRMYGHAPLLMGIYNNYSGYCKVRRRLYVNEHFDKLNLSGKDI